MINKVLIFDIIDSKRIYLLLQRITSDVQGLIVSKVVHTETFH